VRLPYLALLLAGCSAPVAVPVAAPVAEARTFCRAAVLVGDSTALGIVQDPGPTGLITQLRRVGVEQLELEVSAGRMAVGGAVDKPSAQLVARGKLGSGYTGCWILAVGMNDAATEERDRTGIAKRIEAVLAELRGAPVLWVTARTERTQGGYARANMQTWNEGLLAATHYHDNLAVYDWAAEARPEWYAADNVHYNTLGHHQRSARIAAALARAFPAD
jgi:hypothetical protein